LPAAGQGPLSGKKLEKAATILQNVVRRVFVKAGQIKRVVGKGTDAAQPRREAISESVLFQRRANQRSHAVEFAPVKVRLFV